MNRHLLILLILPFLGYSQCPTSGGLFTSQAEIDALATNYPDCTEVEDFLISGNDITDLSGLYQINSCTSFAISDNVILQNTLGLNPNIVIRYVEGTGTSFVIHNNASLLTIDGLENLVSESGFESSFSITNNPMLVSVEGVPNAFNPLTWFSIVNNTSLINLNGLENYGAGEFTTISNNDALIDLTGLDEINGESITISDNDNLQSLNGIVFSGFEDYLYIENNESLTDISAIYAGNWLSINTIIRNNPNLAMCSSENLCNYFASNVEEAQILPGIFENNAPGCNSNFEAEYGCSINSNDDCGYTTNFLVFGNTITANNEFATPSPQTPSCNDIANRKDVWFVFNSEENTTVDVLIEAGFYVQLWEGDCYDLSQVDNACGTELIDIPVASNTEYYIQVWNDDTTERGGNSWFGLTLQEGSLSTHDVQVEGINLFPNPTTGILNMTSNQPMDAVNVYNILGQNVMTLQPNVTTINMTPLKQGMYFIQVEINGKSSIYKVLKQ